MDNEQQRIPPHDYSAEQAILGAILLNNGALDEVRTIIDGDDFCHSAHKAVYAAMLAVAAGGKAIDHVTIGEHLMESGALERMGGPMALDKLTGMLVEGRAGVGRVSQYAGTIRSLTARRAVIQAAEQIIETGYSGKGGVAAYAESARAAISQVTLDLQGKGPQPIGPDIAALHSYLEDDTDPPGLIKTTIAEIDQMGGGLWPGILYTVAARPAMGKSCLLLNVAVNVSLAGKKVLFVTLEDVRQFAAMRIAARMTDINLRDIVLRQVKDKNQWTRLVDTVNKLADRPLWFDDSPGLTSQSIAQMAAAHQAVHGLDLLIIDHLGEVADKGESETSITSRAAMRFRDIAKELNIPVLMASQLNRKVEERTGNVPRLSDLRQSGRIEEASRVVWFLYRPAYYAKDEIGAAAMDLHLIQAKASHGQTGVMRLYVDLSRMHVRSWSEYTDGAWPTREDKTDGEE